MQAQDVRQIEKELSRVLLEYGTREEDAAAVKKWIYESRGPAMAAVKAVQKKFFGLFPENLPPEAIDHLVRVLNDAWNHFPHRSLGGRSPNMMVAEAMKNKPPFSQVPAMPKIICGGREMDWDEYQTMLREMERLQKPFKQWTKKLVLPKYARFLRNAFTTDTADMHYEVADIFFDRVFHVGFLNLGTIRRDFVQKEFPRWWTTHVLMDRKTQKQVLASLRRLFGFLHDKYAVDIAAFGF